MKVCQASLDLRAFTELARRFALSLRPGTVVALHGELGAGKTTFVGAAVRALHGETDDDVSSPTFIFRRRYAGRPGAIPIEHLDLYRIDDPAEAVELGLEDALAGAAIVFVEWPDRLPGFVPSGAVAVRIEGAGDGTRAVTIETPASRLE